MARLFLVRVAFLLLTVPAAASAAALDDYYLSRFGQQAQLAKALRAVVGLEQEPAERCRTHLYRSLKRDFTQLEPETQKTLGKYVARPALAAVATFVSAGGHFNVHYATVGNDAPDLTSADADAVPDWVERVAEVFEQVYAAEVTGMGYRQPPVARYDVYLRDLVVDGAYGLTSNDGFPSGGNVSVGSYIEIDKAFTDPIFTVNGRYTADQMLRITAAHEFHHAIQFGYNYYFEMWYAEVTATWMEDEVYDGVNQLYSYLPQYLPVARTVSLNGGLGNNSEYGRWIFNRYLGEAHGEGVVRAFWDKLATLLPSTSPVTSTGDIQMSPVLDSVLTASYGSSLGNDFFGLAKRAYTRAWSSHTTELSLIPQHAVAASYSSYPVGATTATTSVTLPRYTFAFYRFIPSTSVPNLDIAVSKTSGIRSAVFRKTGATVAEISANTGDASYTVAGFGSLNPATDEVVLLVANATGVDSHQAFFSTNGTVRALPEPSSSAAGGGGGGGGGGCFIATAAYGSYLHPKVAELRRFRDSHLLTNAPGRLFVSLYYRLSPPLAEVIGEHEWLRGGVRVLLVPLLLAVEHPAGALALVLVAAGAGLRRLARRQGRFA